MSNIFRRNFQKNLSIFCKQKQPNFARMEMFAPCNMLPFANVATLQRRQAICPKARRLVAWRVGSTLPCWRLFASSLRLHDNCKVCCWTTVLQFDCNNCNPKSFHNKLTIALQLKSLRPCHGLNVVDTSRCWLCHRAFAIACVVAYCATAIL